jgi:hypothetical protein
MKTCGGESGNRHAFCLVDWLALGWMLFGAVCCVGGWLVGFVRRVCRFIRNRLVFAG